MAITLACRHTQKAPHAAHAEPTIPVAATGPAGRPRARYPQRLGPDPVLPHNTDSAASGLPADCAGKRTRRPEAG